MTDEEWTLSKSPLPGHVIVLTGTSRQRGWLLARENGPAGWFGLVQYYIDDVEMTRYLPAERIASPDDSAVPKL